MLSPFTWIAYYVIFDKILYTVDPVTCNLTSPIPLPFYVITPVIVSSNHLSSVGIGSMIDVWFDEDGYVASFVTPVPFDVDNRFDWQVLFLFIIFYFLKSNKLNKFKFKGRWSDRHTVRVHLCLQLFLFGRERRDESFRHYLDSNHFQCSSILFWL